MSGLFRNIGWLLTSRGVNALFSLVYLTLATRTLGLADFGRFSLIIVLAQAIVGLASFQTWQAVVRWGNVGSKGGGTDEGRTVAGFALALDMASVAAGGMLAALACWIAPRVLPLPPELRWAAFAQCMAALIAVRSTPTGLLRLYDRFDRATLAEAALPALRAAGAIIAALTAPRIEAFVAAWALAELGCSAAYWNLARRLQPISRRDISLFELPRRHPGVWRFVWATNFSRSLAVTSKQVLLLLVGALGGAALAGGYRVASQLGQALVQLAEAVGRAIYPELVRRAEDAAQLASNMTRLAVLAGALAVALSAFGGRWAIEALAGPSYGFAAPAMIVLTLAGACELAVTSWDALLVAQGRAEIVFLLRALPLALAVAAIPAAMAGAGLVGVALCLLGSGLMTLGGFVYLAARGPKSQPAE